MFPVGGRRFCVCILCSAMRRRLNSIPIERICSQLGFLATIHPSNPYSFGHSPKLGNAVALSRLKTLQRPREALFGCNERSSGQLFLGWVQVRSVQAALKAAKESEIRISRASIYMVALLKRVLLFVMKILLCNVYESTLVRTKSSRK